MSEKDIKKTSSDEESNISRRKALQKMGYAAFASSTMFLLLNNPTKVYASSQEPTDPGDDPGPFGGGSGTGNKNNQQSNDPWKRDDDPWK